MSDWRHGIGRDRAPLAALRGFVRQRLPEERCELCGTGIAPEHAHVVRSDRRQLICACEPCALLFAGAGSTAYKRVPRAIIQLDDFAISDEQWDALAIPIDLAFFFYSSHASQMVAVYPSPAGATESLLPLAAWGAMADRHPRLRVLDADVEALLVNRVRQRSDQAGARYFIVPIDECYRLVGVIRKSWRGLAGGAVVWGEIADYFARLEARARRAAEPARA